ncbi:preprotein translocase subunit SecG [Blochmannia endosymbiont of Polyrhachis (Hedomyrma) turneri]|uniref:preprotein translocase subunit SecG n=1 Tax=Blochmannia endosymbiont of Polyrhachis (Hedomyrma) turneri TaxID=1505596 RepID=UPI00061A5848|nr:preprotein translocase subunit SecG [Blochmannia endosymbiont of Polyrhachis (Hedomyrma) turneri]AKC59687.1 Protein-export membrane protein SecG [Blochmannia endosymbiont of Polyrhachis (Hedomyrma) turneri]
MYTIFLVIYLLVAISLVVLIMLQHGRGIDFGGDAFNVRSTLGGWSTNLVGNFMTRLITVLGVLFFFLSLLLGNINNQHNHEENSSIDDSRSLQKLHDDAKVSSVVENIPKSLLW